MSGRVVADAPPAVQGANLGLVRDGGIILCSWHLWEFEIATGRCQIRLRARVTTYSVAVAAGQVVVHANPDDLPLQGQTATAR